MSLTQKDLQLIKNMLESTLDVRFTAYDKRMVMLLEQHAQDIKCDIRDEMDAKFTAFERRMTKIFDEKLNALEIHLTKKIEHLTSDVASFLGEHVIPRISVLEEHMIH